MKWTVIFDEDFETEFEALSGEVQDELYAEAAYVEEMGPEAGRPHVDTLKGSTYANMKELRFVAENSEWRAAFAFDPKRRAVLLVAGQKSGASQKQFYRRLIAKADARFGRHLQELKAIEKRKR